MHTCIAAQLNMTAVNMATIAAPGLTIFYSLIYYIYSKKD